MFQLLAFNYYPNIRESQLYYYYNNNHLNYFYPSLHIVLIYHKKYFFQFFIVIIIKINFLQKIHLLFSIIKEDQFIPY